MVWPPHSDSHRRKCCLPTISQSSPVARRAHYFSAFFALAPWHFWNLVSLSARSIPKMPRWFVSAIDILRGKKSIFAIRCGIMGHPISRPSRPRSEIRRNLTEEDAGSAARCRQPLVYESKSRAVAAGHPPSTGLSHPGTTDAQSRSLDSDDVGLALASALRRAG